MTNSTQTRTGGRSEREARERSTRRAEQASIVAGLQTTLEPSEQLLGFARGRIAGGFRGKMTVGPEAFFAPFVNIGLTERRLVLQHIRPENGKPSDILPHFFMLSDIATLDFSDIETFGAEPACRLVVRLNSELYCRLRLRGALNFESAQTLAKVFASLSAPRRNVTTPTQRTCPNCSQILDQPYRFCPYCGVQQPEREMSEEARDEMTADAEPDQAEFDSGYRPEETPDFYNDLTADAEPDQAGEGAESETEPFATAQDAASTASANEPAGETQTPVGSEMSPDTAAPDEATETTGDAPAFFDPFGLPIHAPHEVTDETAEDAAQEGTH